MYCSVMCKECIMSVVLSIQTTLFTNIQQELYEGKRQEERCLCHPTGNNVRSQL